MALLPFLLGLAVLLSILETGSQRLLDEVLVSSQSPEITFSEHRNQTSPSFKVFLGSGISHSPEALAQAPGSNIYLIIKSSGGAYPSGLCEKQCRDEINSTRGLWGKFLRRLKRNAFRLQCPVDTCKRRIWRMELQPAAARLESPGQRGTHTEHSWPHSGCPVSGKCGLERHGQWWNQRWQCKHLSGRGA